MLQQLPAELLGLILALLHDQDLCNLATCTRRTHAVCLHELFARNKTFQATDTVLAMPPPGISVKLLPSSPKICVTFTNKANISVLRGLRLALPDLFEHQCPVIALYYKFRGPMESNLLMDELKALRLVLERFIPTIESIVLDFSATESTGFWHDGSPSLGNEYSGEAFLNLLSLIDGSARISGKGFTQCVSLTIHGGPFGDPYPFEINQLQSSWLQKGTRPSNAVQTVMALASRPFTSLRPRKLKWRSRSNSKGICALNLHSYFFFHHVLIDWTFHTLHQHSHTLRSLSLHHSKLLSHEWSTVLERISLPCLEEFHFGGNYCVPMTRLAVFLIRHRTIKILDLGGERAEFAKAQPWCRPPSFLPNLTTLKASISILCPLLCPRTEYGSEMARSTLRFVTMAVTIDGDGPCWLHAYNEMIGSYIQRLDEVTLTLQFHVNVRTTGWLEKNDTTEGKAEAESYDRVRYIEVYLWRNRGLLEIEAIKWSLADWLARYPAVEGIAIVGCNPMSESCRRSRQELFEMVREKNPRISSFRVNGVSVE